MKFEIEEIKQMDKTALIYTKGYIEGIMSTRELTDDEKMYYKHLMNKFNQVFVSEIDEVYKEMFS